MVRAFLLAVAVLPALVVPLSAQTAPEAVTYADVLRSPDSVPVNVAYARKQIGEGNVNGAAATLERILLIVPDADDVRLLYAAVLMRTDDPYAASRQIEILKGRPLSAAQQAELEAIEGTVSRKLQDTTLTAYLTAGARYDTNRNFVSFADTGVFMGVPFATGGREEDDVAGLLGGGVELTHDLGTAAGHTFFVGADALLNVQAEQSDYSFAFGNTYAGFNFVLGAADLNVRAVVRSYTLGDDPFAVESGGIATLSGQVVQGVSAFATTELFYQDFRNLPLSPRADQRDGTYLRSSAGLVFQPSPVTRITVRGAYLDKSGDDHLFPIITQPDPLVLNYSYSGVEAEIALLLLPGQGQYVQISGLARSIGYDEPDPLIDPNAEREDDVFKVRASYGVPFGTIAGWMGKEIGTALGQTVLQLGIEHYVQNSNFGNYDYRNTSADAMVVRRFAF